MIDPITHPVANRAISRQVRLLATTVLAGAAMATPALGQDALIVGGDYVNAGAPAINVDLPSGDIHVSIISAATTGDDATAINLAADDGEITLFVDENVATTGDDSYGIRAIADGDVLIAVGGTVTTVGDQSAAVIASSLTGNIDVALNGDVATSGVGATAVSLIADLGNIDLDTRNVMTIGNGAGGIDVLAFHGDVRVTTGAVITMGDFADAVTMTGTNIDFEAFDAIATSGDYSSGISVSGTEVELDFTDISTAGDFSHAISATVNGGELDINGDHILTTGEEATAVEVQVTNGSTLIVLDSVTARGFGSGGVEINARNSDVIAAVETIRVEGEAAGAGLTVNSDGQGTTGVEVGDVTTLAWGVEGIRINVEPAGLPTQRPLGSPAADVATLRHEGIIVTAGSVSTAGDEAYGIEIFVDDSQVGMGPAGAINLLAENITTTGDRAWGVRMLDIAGHTNVSLAVGNITTTGETSYGVAANVGASDLTFVSPGLISTTGTRADGLRFLTRGDMNVSAARVYTTGYGAEAIHLSDSFVPAPDSEPQFITVVAEDVRTEGRDASAINIRSERGHIDVTATNVSAIGSLSDGVSIRGGSGDVNVRSSGLVHTRGHWGDGVGVSTASGDIDILANDVTTEGDYTFGLVGATDDGGDISIRLLGDLTTSGNGSTGVGAIATYDPTIDQAGGDIDIHVFGTISVSGDPVDQSPLWPVRGHGIVVHGADTRVTIGEEGHIESSNGYAYLGLDRTLTGPNGQYVVDSQDRLSLFGSIVGDLSFGNGDDEFAIYEGADISGVGLADGGNGQDLLQFAGWRGTADSTNFTGFEDLFLAEGSEVRLNGSWAFDSVELSDAHLLLSNGASLTGDVSLIDFSGRSAISFLDAGVSSSRLSGNIDATFGGVGLNFVDGRGDDTGLITGSISGSAYVNMDVGIGNGGLVEADRLNVGGAVNGELIVYLNPYSTDGAHVTGPLFNIGGGVENVVLANGPLHWGGQVFDLSVEGSTQTSQQKSTGLASAHGGSASVSMVSLGFTSTGAAPLALPVVMDALDLGIISHRSQREREQGSEPMIWASAGYDDIQADSSGINIQGETSSITFGGQMQAFAGWTAGMMLRIAETETDLDQLSLGRTMMDIDSRAIGASLGWASSQSERYARFELWATDRDVSFAAVEIESQGLIASAEMGTYFDISENTWFQPLAQMVWSSAEVDSFTDTISGIDIQPGDTASLHVRGGGVLHHAISESWAVNAHMIADLNIRDSGRTFLASGYEDVADLAGMGGEYGLSITGQAGEWSLSGGLFGRLGGGADASDSQGVRLNIGRKF